MDRQAINPESDWAKNFQFNQGEIIQGVKCMFYISGQISAESDPLVPQGVSVEFKDDQRKQMINALGKSIICLKERKCLAKI